MENIEVKIAEQKIIAVVAIQSEEELEPCMESLLEGGIQAMELVLRTPYAVRAAERVAKQYPEILLGIGTVLKSEDVELAQRISADFAVSPGLNTRVLDCAKALGVPFFPGIATPSNIESALEYNLRLLKFFPAEPLGGLRYLQSIHAPYAHLGLRYIPLGGVGQNNLEEYLKTDCVIAVGGSWLASRKLIEMGDWKAIVRLCREAVLVKNSL